MVFSSIPVYLDPPNWQQQPNHHQANGSENAQLLPPLAPQSSHMGGGGSSIRPGSMADRARLAKIPPPEAALKCPRCESTNTKFCYFNNYSLSQPRHFCKTCRRYWTRGGALRNVPVGGGCRRKPKKEKRSRSKSPAAAEKQTLPNSASAIIPSAGTTDLIHQLPQPSNLPFMASLQNLSRYGVGNTGLNLREIQAQADQMGFPLINNSTGVNNILSGGVDSWRLQQFPFLNGFESSSAGSYEFQSESVEAPTSGLVGDGPLGSTIGTSSRVTQLPPVKLEDNRGLNLSRSSLGVSENNQYYPWTDLSGLAPSSASQLL